MSTDPAWDKMYLLSLSQKITFWTFKKNVYQSLCLVPYYFWLKRQVLIMIMVILIKRWSFGILLWETFTLGGTPYPALPTEQLLDYLSDGKRMDMPTKCPLEVYTIMRDCWIHEPEQRPHFITLTERLAKILEKHTTTVLNYWYTVWPISITGWLANWRNGLLTWSPDYLTDWGLTDRPTHWLLMTVWLNWQVDWPTVDLSTGCLTTWQNQYSIMYKAKTFPWPFPRYYDSFVNWDLETASFNCTISYLYDSNKTSDWPLATTDGLCAGKRKFLCWSFICLFHRITLI